MGQPRMDSMKEIQLSDGKSYMLNNIYCQLEAAAGNVSSASIMMISGPPGIGKSEYMAQLCREEGFGLVAKYMATMMLEQITGLPKGLTDKNLEYTEWTKPDLFNFKDDMLVNPKTKDSPIVLFLDDIHLAAKTIQSYMFQLLTYRSIHSHQLPKNVVMIMAGNRAEDKAGANSIMAPISNRMFFLDVNTSAKSWILNYAIPNGVRDDIVAFITYHEQMLSQEPLESTAWASPRSWTYASDHLNACEGKNGALDLPQIQRTLAGHVGTEYASKFVEFKDSVLKWEPLKILKKQKKINIDDLKDMQCYSLVSSVVTEMLRVFRENDFKKNKELDGYLKVFKELILEDMFKRNRIIVPMGLRMFLLAEQNATSDLVVTREMLENEDILKELNKLI